MLDRHTHAWVSNFLHIITDRVMNPARNKSFLIRQSTRYEPDIRPDFSNFSFFIE